MKPYSADPKTDLDTLRAELDTLAADLRKATDSQFSRALMIGRVNALIKLLDTQGPTNDLD